MTMSHSAAADPATTELIEKIRHGLGPTLSRRIGPHHAAVLATLLELGDIEPEVRTLYKAMLDSGRDMVMARLYRVLRVLEEAGVIHRDWVAHGGRVRGVYRVRDDLRSTHRGAMHPKGAPDFAHRVHGGRTLITFTDGR